MTVKLMTPVFRVSYAHVFKPTANDKGEESYSLSMIFNKSETPPEEIAKLQKGIKDALTEKWGPDKTKWPRQLKLCLRDADTEDRTNKGDPKYDPAYVNSFFMSARSGNRPGVVDENVNPIVDESQFYSGCYARATVVLKAYDKGGGKGVGCYLQNIMKVRDGERIGGAPPAEEDFASFRSSAATEDASSFVE